MQVEKSATLLHDGITYLVTENNKVKNTVTGGYIRKAEKVKPIIEKAEIIREKRIDAHRKEMRIQEAREKATKKRIENAKAKRTIVPQKKEKPVEKPNTTIFRQVAYEFLILGLPISTIKRETSKQADQILKKLGLSENHQGNFKHVSKRNIVGTLKRYNQSTLLQLLDKKIS